MNMKKGYVLSLSLFVGLFCVAPLALGQIKNPSNYNDFPALLGGLADKIGMLLASLGAIMIVIAGIFYLLSAGVPERVNTAKKALMYAVGGIIVGSTAVAISTWVQQVAQGNDVNTIINQIASWAGTFVSALGGIMFIVAGMIYLLAGGDPTKIKMAKTALIYAVAGIAIGLLATTIVGIIRTAAGF